MFNVSSTVIAVCDRSVSRGMWNIMQTKDEKNKNNNDTELNTRYKIECKVNERPSEHVCEIWDFWMEKIVKWFTWIIASIGSQMDKQSGFSFEIT